MTAPLSYLRLAGQLFPLLFDIPHMAEKGRQVIGVSPVHPETMFQGSRVGHRLKAVEGRWIVKGRWHKGNLFSATHPGE